jgi:hypothetical protein
MVIIDSKRISFFILLFSTLIAQSAYSQQWTIVCHSDYYIELYNLWNEDVKEIEVIVTLHDQRLTYSAQITIKGNKPSGVHFPYDFVAKQVDSSLLEISSPMQITAYYKKSKISSLETMYDPAENSTMQLEVPGFEVNKSGPISIWGTLIDKYTWMDKSGENLVVRSSLTHTIFQKNDSIHKHYVYVYHFRRNNDNESWVPIKKYSDVITQCNQSVFQPFDISFFYLTDLDKNGIGEINYRYALNCPSTDSIPPNIKTVLITEGRRYSATYLPNELNDSALTTNFPFTGNAVFTRYINRIGNIPSLRNE